MSRAELRRIEGEVVHCARCPRLAGYLCELRSAHVDYWNRPVPGFGDRGAWLVIVGLAPGRHGANRSGRPFYMDPSGEWLYGELERRGLWNGRRLRGVYILNAVKCCPPQNKPLGPELDTCRSWLARELAALRAARVALALGALAHTSVLKCWGVTPLSHHRFSHGAVHRFPARPALLSSYHPSRQNTNTGVLTRRMWSGIFRSALRLGEARG